MLIGIEKIAPYERQMLCVFKQAMERCPDLDINQQTRIESLLQDIVDVWTKRK